MSNFEDSFQKLVQQYKQNKLHGFTVHNKVRKIADYLQEHNINNVVIGISGGLDSSTVLGLLYAVKMFHCPNLKIHGYCITFDKIYGLVFNKSFVVKLMHEFCGEDITIDIIDCSSTIDEMFSDLKLKAYNMPLMAQSSYALRYQILFTYAQLHKGITIGTTNRDEMEYVGWFGKNSDMVVDLQVISDWHKFEVVEAAARLRVPHEIIMRVPTGDLIDGTSDEENFGCTYDELAYFSQAQKELSQYDLELKYGKVLELHKKNSHKYQGQTFNPVFIR